VSNTKPVGAIVGKINADPNPIPFGQRSVLISWDTNDPAGAEVRVSASSGEEKVVSQGRSGQTEIRWVVGSTAYDFRLYAASQPTAPIDSVEVKRDFESVPVIFRALADEVLRGKIGMAHLSQFLATVMPHVGVAELSQLLATVIPRCLHSGKFNEIFRLWECHGFHVTPVHFYQPIPDTQTLPEALWDRPSELVGIDMNDSGQLDLLRRHFPKFRDEYEQIPIKSNGDGFHLNNTLFGGTDALVAYCMVRQFQPRLIIEIGSGLSSLLLAEAALRNDSSALICIEPFPRKFVRKGFPGLQSLIEKKVQDIDLEFFSRLDSRDLLFIDSCHTVKIGGDVNYLFLEVLPRLKPGVIVHVHDIFLPFEYRRDWVMDEFRFWSEQYLLQAFLTFNSEFEVLMANYYLARRYQEDLKAAFPILENLKTVRPNSGRWDGGSFWMRRRPAKVDSLSMPQEG
jgi:hypothetical protein